MTNLLISQFNGQQKRFPVLNQDVVLLPLKGPMPVSVRDRRLRQRVRRAHELSKCKGLIAIQIPLEAVGLDTIDRLANGYEADVAVGLYREHFPRHLDQVDPRWDQKTEAV